MDPHPDSSIVPLQEWMVNCDSDARASPFFTLFRCIPNACVGPYIVDLLFGSMFTNGSARTADLRYADVMLCILLTIPLQPGRGRINCKHNTKVLCVRYNQKGMYGKQQACLNSSVNIKKNKKNIFKNIIFIIFN